MNATTMQGPKADFAYLKEEGSRIVIGYALTKLSKSQYQWREITLYRKQLSQTLTLQMVKDAIIADINAQVRQRITSGHTWQDKPVWLSEENQMNFAQAITPATLKIGEQEDGTPVYHDFATDEDLTAFNQSWIAYRQQCLADGWAEKDAVDFTPYESFFPAATAAEETTASE